MKTFSLLCLPALLTMLSPALSADDTVGVVRLSDVAPRTVVLGQSPDLYISESESTDDSHSEGTHTESSVQNGYCPEGYCPQGYCPDPYYSGCPTYSPCFCHHSVLSNNWLANCLRNHSMAFRCRTQIASAQMHASCQTSCHEHSHWFRSKFGYFFPTGCCGRGCPPIGHYSMVYPLDPNYFDQRDGQIYAAQGYCGPVSVPLAPVVRHSYNYGWGVPSSRLTPISHPAPTYVP